VASRAIGDEGMGDGAGYDSGRHNGVQS
jgi:hypothetical protein